MHRITGTYIIPLRHPLLVYVIMSCITGAGADNLQCATTAPSANNPMHLKAKSRNLSIYPLSTQSIHL